MPTQTVPARGLGEPATIAMIASAALSTGGGIFGSIMGSNAQDKQAELMREARRIQGMQTLVQQEMRIIKQQVSTMTAEEAQRIQATGGQSVRIRAENFWRRRFRQAGLQQEDIQIGTSLAASWEHQLHMEAANWAIVKDNLPVIAIAGGTLVLGGIAIYKIAQNKNDTDPQDATQSNA